MKTQNNLHQKYLSFWILVLISLTLVWCSSASQETSGNDVVAEKLAQVEVIEQQLEEEIEKVVQLEQELEDDVAQAEDLIEDLEEIEAQEQEIADNLEEDIIIEQEVEEGLSQITSTEIIYAAKVWDSIEAHPARLTVTVTLDDDVIESVNIAQQNSSPKSARHQAQFASQIEWTVVGKTLSESDDIYLSVASSTSWAFNDAIKEIQEIYEQSQS